MTNYKSIAHHALECAKRHGAQETNVIIRRDIGCKITGTNASYDIYSDIQIVLNIDLYVDGHLGHYRTSELRHDSLDKSIQNAIEMTRMLDTKQFNRLPDPSLYKNRAEIDLEQFDPEVSKITPNKQIEMCTEIAEICVNNKDLTGSRISADNTVYTYDIYMINTNGLEDSIKSTKITNGCYIVIDDDDDNKIILEHETSTARYLSDLRKPEEIAARGIEKCLFQIGAKPISTKKRTIILDRAINRLLDEYVKALDGNIYYRENNFLSGKVGQVIASPLMDLHDDPWIKRGLGSTLFDIEGISSKPSVVIDHGKLEHIYVDTNLAREQNLKPTSARSNLVITPGKRSMRQMIGDVEDGIYVLALLGGTTNISTGDFSYGIIGVAIENGKLGQNVSQMIMTGNHLELWKNLTEVGNDTYKESRIRMPTLRFDNVLTNSN